MLAPLDITIDETTFQTKGLAPVDVLRLDKTILGLIAPALSGLKVIDGKLNIEFDKSAAGLANLLIQLPDDILVTFLVKLFSRTVWVGVQGAVELKSEKAINAAFAETTVLSIYKLAFEIMRYNKFSFFEKMGSGSEILKTFGLQGPTQNSSENGTKSEASEPLTTT